MKDDSLDRGPKVVDLAALAVYAGGNGVDCAEGLAQIDANHSQLAHKLEASRTGEIGSLEAQQTTLAHLEPQAQERWRQLRDRHKQDPPRFLAPLAVGLVAVGIAVAEASLLAPILDMIRVTDPVLQLVLAGAITLSAASVSHVAFEARRNESSSNRLLLCVAGGFLLILVAVGIWRAEALTFAATHSRSALGAFLAEWPGLTALVTCLLTVMLPLASALGFDHAAHHIRQWWHFRKARRTAERLKTALDSVTKQVESAKEKLAHDLEVIQQQNEEWKAQYRHYWQLGRENGARKGPVWPVWVKTAAVVLGVMLLCGLALSALGVPGAILGGGIAGIAAGLAAAAHFYHQWEHPTPEQYLRNVNTRFTDTGARHEVRVDTITLDKPERGQLLPDPQRRELARSARGGAR